MSKPLDKLLAQALKDNGHDYSEKTQEQLLLFLELLQKWNRVFNLTAIRDPEEQIFLHLLDSLSIYPFLHGQRMLDVGSGGGLPGIPLAIVDPAKDWVLLDKSEKKTRFLVQAAAELGLKNVRVVCERCENFQTEPGFDSIVSRAFGTIALMLASTQHLLAPGGQVLAMKGTYPEDEMKELPPEFKLLDVQKLSIQGLKAERHLLKILRSEK